MANKRSSCTILNKKIKYHFTVSDTFLFEKMIRLNAYDKINKRCDVMNIELLLAEKSDICIFKRDIQEAFQKGFEDVFNQISDVILPEKDIDCSLNAKGSIVYKAVIDGQMVGGAIVVIDENTQHNHLDLLYVKYGIQAKGIGYQIWSSIEKLHPDTKVWETCTPYFDKRNIHFYVNKCGFHIIKFFNKFNPDPLIPEDFIGDGGEGMFVFQKQM